MEFWKFAAIITWICLGASVIFFFYLKKQWFLFGKEVLLGHRLHSSINKLFSEIEERKISKDTLSDVSKHVLWRLTRIGFFAVIAALIPVTFVALQSYLLSNQNQLLLKQNDRIDLQNNLLEADRRSSLVFLMSNVLDRADVEISRQRETMRKGGENVSDSVKYSLSKPLTNRIVALSRAFRPYRMLQGDSLSRKIVSPERGQLFIALMDSGLDSLTQSTVAANGNFSYAVIGRTSLKGAYLSGINLQGADLIGTEHIGDDFLNAYYLREALNINDPSGKEFIVKRHGVNRSDIGFHTAGFRNSRLYGTEFNKANLEDANFRQADLRWAIFENASLRYANLRESNLEYSDFHNSDLTMVNFHGANLKKANLKNVDLSYADFTMANLSEVDFTGANLTEVEFQEAKGITFEQLKKVKCLLFCRNLDPELEQKLEAEKPCLFTFEGCNQ